MVSFETVDNSNSVSSTSTTMQFDESKFKLRSRAVLGEPQVPGMIRFLVGKNLVKTETQAITILLIIIVLIIGVTVFIFKRQSVQSPQLDQTLFEYR